MKHLIRLTLTLLPFAGYAQNTTYAVEVHVPADVLATVPQVTIETAISIRGLKRVTTSPSLTVSFSAQDLVISEDSVKEFVEVQKDSSGNEASRTTSYYVEVLYSLKCEGKCYNAQKQLVYSASWGLGRSKYISGHMPTRQAAEDYWKNNKENLKSSFIASIVNSSIVAMGNKLSATMAGPYPSAKN